MKYTWRVFKYSKFINDEKDMLSYCNHNLEEVSQTIIHSQYDSQFIRKERWLHVLMEKNRFIEISMTNNLFEVKLIVHTPPSFEVMVLEHIEIKKELFFCIKERVLGCKFKDNTKRFQITFNNIDEVNIFFDKYSSLINIIKEKGSSFGNRKLLEDFFKLIEGTKIHYTLKKKMKTEKSKKQLIREFLDLVKS